ncbi:unnamed protein product [marine sediment metagenome]|uniref:Aldehyde oxidase/xanthine dehydrogenase second molybdopterin binding domain-containing protein n=1 Tax=marine sediment metagenome TaxID=412755 RepID=X1LPL2_9ZZZZ
MVLKYLIRENAYYDSVTLMIITREVKKIEGVREVIVGMGTELNKELAGNLNLLTPELQGITPNDFFISLDSIDDNIAKKAFAFVDELLSRKKEESEDYQPSTFESALKYMPDANLVLISLPGKYAAREAKKALLNDKHVMIFSDNVTLEEEIELKKLAKQRGILMMGPDCGTAIINHVALAFANVIRRKNALKDGGTTVTGQVVENVGFVKCLDKVAKDIEWDKRVKKVSKTKYRGKGIAGMYKAPSMPNNVGSSAIVKINEDGTVNLLVTAMDLGQGSDTALTQIAAEVLTIPVSKISIITGDTDCTPYEWQTVASRTIYCCGNSIIRAAKDAKKQLLRLASLKFGIPEDDLELKDGQVISKIYSGKKVKIADLAMGLTMPDGSGIHGPIIGRGAFIPPDVRDTDKETGQGDKPVAFWTFGVQAAEVEVDIETGEVKVLKIAAAYDVGKAINPDLICVQIEGGIVQGLGSALLEEMKIKEGKVLNPSFVDYKIPTTEDAPEMKISIVEVPEPTGPWGARGIAEACMVPTAPAIANAVFDAIGCRINSLPVTAEKVLKAIMEKKR